MRKFTFFVFMMCSFVYAQNYTNKANRKSAERCLKVAENYLMTGDFANAKSQAFLGITYDDSISDLYSRSNFKVFVSKITLYIPDLMIFNCMS